MALSRNAKIIFGIFIGAIITVVFLAEIADTSSLITDTFTIANVSFVVPAQNASLALEGRELVSGGVIYNLTGPVLESPTNITIQDGVLNGTKTVFVTNVLANAGTEMNASYVFGGEGYLERSGDRAMMTLVILMSALAITVFVIVMLFKGQDMIDLIGKFK